MSKTESVPYTTDELDDLDEAILDYFTEGRDEDRPWGKATPSEIYRALETRGTLEKLGNPVRQTVQNRIKNFSLAGHLENKYDTGSYELVSDPREEDSDVDGE